MDAHLGYILLLCVLYGVYSSPVLEQETRVKRNSDKITDLRSKLTRLQDLLQQIQKEDPGSENVKKDVKSSINPDVKTPETERSMIHTESEMGNAKKTQIPKLTPDEAELLQALKLTLEKEKEDRQQNDLERLKSQKSEKKGTYNVDKKNEQSDTHRFVDNQLNDLKNRNSEMEEELKSYVQPKEGRFGSFQQDGKEDQSYIEKSTEVRYKLFRQKVLRALEQRLLEDINDALNHGFSLEEILRDLQRADAEANIEEMEAIEKKLSELRRSQD